MVGGVESQGAGVTDWHQVALLCLGYLVDADADKAQTSHTFICIHSIHSKVYTTLISLQL